MNVVISTLLLYLLSPPLAWAETAQDEVRLLRQQVEQLTQTVQGLTATVQMQQTRLRVLEAREGSRGNSSSQLQASASSPAAPPRTSGRSQSLAALNPEIGVNADIVAQLSESPLDAEGNDKISAREVEPEYAANGRMFLTRSTGASSDTSTRS